MSAVKNRYAKLNSKTEFFTVNRFYSIEIKFLLYYIFGSKSVFQPIIASILH